MLNKLKDILINKHIKQFAAVATNYNSNRNKLLSTLETNVKDIVKNHDLTEQKKIFKESQKNNKIQYFNLVKLEISQKYAEHTIGNLNQIVNKTFFDINTDIEAQLQNEQTKQKEEESNKLIEKESEALQNAISSAAVKSISDILKHIDQSIKTEKESETLQNVVSSAAVKSISDILEKVISEK